jgi:hypothetical protein
MILELVPLVDQVLLKGLDPCKWSLVQTEREVEALRIVVATSILDGEGVASEPLYWILLRIVLGVRNWMLVSLRGGGGELGNLKPLPMASLSLHKDKLEHTI